MLIVARAGCQGGGESAPSPSSSVPSTTSSGPRAHVLAVEIDNAGPARPQTGLDKADIVYVEQVEAGLGRILAVHSSELPPVVGPVHSARETDLELLHLLHHPGRQTDDLGSGPGLDRLRTEVTRAASA
ncbi:DUF3048 domain-containing protein [Streptomyces sp. NPDC056638]|uniref:DUF3048 domain-containing protein n=1 Tax=Streptomyces sp. NPDC056638 TaxID=3345887 RepID=UPI00369A3BA4